VLFWDDEPLCDSTRIIEALEDRAPEPPLYPEVPDVRRCALELEDFFDEELGPHLGALVIHALFGRGREATAAAFGMTQPE
jgi:glutathione S-transferase